MYTSCPYCPSLLRVQCWCNWEEAGKRPEEDNGGMKLTGRHHRLKYSHRRSPTSPPELSDKSRSPYCAE